MALHKSLVIRAAQRPALFFYVPLMVFMVEAMALTLIYMSPVGLWVIGFFPIHLLLVGLTNEDFRWPQKLLAHITLYMAQPTRGLRNKNAVTFSPAVMRAHRERDHGYL